MVIIYVGKEAVKTTIYNYKFIIDKFITYLDNEYNINKYHIMFHILNKGLVTNHTVEENDEIYFTFGKISAINILHRLGIKINIKSLHYHITNIYITTLLINAGININAVFANTNILMILTIANTNLATIKILKFLGLNLKTVVVNNKEICNITYNIIYNRVNIVKYLLTIYPYSLENLEQAIKINRIDCIHELLKCSKPYNYEKIYNNFSNFKLISKNILIFNLILEYGIKLYEENEYNMLIWAYEIDNIEIFDMILKYIDDKAKNTTQLMGMLIMNNDLKYIQSILDSGVNLHVYDNNKNIYLFNAKKYNNKKIYKLIYNYIK